MEPTFDNAKVYPIEEAVKILRTHSKEKFDASIELHSKLGIDPKQNTQQIRATVTLPHSFGKSKIVAAFVTPDKEKLAKEAGADIVGGQDMIDALKTTAKINFEVAVAVPEMMKNMTAVAKVLGPRGLMPSPKNDTITMDLHKTIGEIKKGKINYKNDDTSNIHVTIGKMSLDDQKIVENFHEFMNNLKKNKPSSSKGIYLRSVTICSTMGPAIKVEVPK